MFKLLTLLVFSAACFSKLSITSFKEQTEYAGIQGGITVSNYTIEIKNTENNEIEVEAIWVKGRWITFSQKTYSGDPIIIKASIKHIYSDSLKTKMEPPSKRKKDRGVVKYRIKNKDKIRYLGTETIIRERALARP
tara:strand:- start:148 stop:555 length:408 start_codon:yes stop_codon:yes gene_type:complete